MRSVPPDEAIPIEQKTERLYYIDWIRIFGMLIIFIYHCCDFFSPSDWYVKNNVLSPNIALIPRFFDLWIMPLFFIVSAMSSFYSLTKRSPKQYFIERFKRLAIPFIFGIFVIIVPVQVYIKRVTQGQFSIRVTHGHFSDLVIHNHFNGSFIEFYPHYFDGLYAFGGNFAFFGLHLWYLGALFVFSVLTLPLFMTLRKQRFSSIVSKVTLLFTRPGAIFLLAAFIILIRLFVVQYKDIFIIGTPNFAGSSLLVYLVYFIIGYFLLLIPKLSDVLETHRIKALIIAVGITLLWIVNYFYELESVIKYQEVLEAVFSWCWLLTIFGFGSKYVSFNHPVLKYANEALLPFYILHQFVIVVIGFWIAQWEIGLLAKYLILSSFSFVTIMIMYEYLVKRVSVMRFMFGMK